MDSFVHDSLSRLRLLLIVSGICWGGLATSQVLAESVVHPFHISVAEMEYNPKSKRFEVSLKMHASDLESACNWYC